MRKVVGLSMVLLILLGATLVIVAGCGGGSAPESSSKAQSTSSGVSDSELQALAYPGAKKEDVDTAGGPMPGNGSSAPPAPGDRPEGVPDGSMPPQGGFQRPSALAAYWTGDSLEKVSAWYEQQLSGKTGFEEVSMPSRGGSAQDGSVKIYSFKSGDASLMLMVRDDSRDRGGTVITVSEAPEGMPGGPPANQGQ